MPLGNFQFNTKRITAQKSPYNQLDDYAGDYDKLDDDTNLDVSKFLFHKLCPVPFN
jgi:hypothetical protein